MSELDADRWAQDWPDNVVLTAQSIGYRDLTHLLNSMPAKPYAKVVLALNDQFAPAQIVSVQYGEAHKAGTVRNAARDALCRHIVKRFPDGWHVGEKAEWQAIRAISSWSSEALATGNCKEFESRFDNIGDHLLKDACPPKGWIPTGPDDPVITEAFDKYWPEE